MVDALSTIMCDGACAEADCCVAATAVTCADSPPGSCDAGSSLISPAPETSYCAADPCVSAECCEADAVVADETCADFTTGTCTSPMVDALSTIMCDGACAEADCCVAATAVTCADSPPGSCDAGSSLISPAPETSYCAADPCVSAECCEADAVVADETCADFTTGTCTSPMVDALSTIMCDGACAEADCCVAATAVTCADSPPGSCDAGSSLISPAPETSYCAADPCVSAECCEADAVVADETCADFTTGTCTSPMVDALSTIMCDGACAEADCCVAATAVTCADSPPGSCDAGSSLISPAPETSYCAADPCVSAECCEADAVVADETCADFTTGTCTSPMVDALSTITCDGACAEADCCVAATAVTCADSPPGSCDAGSSLISPAPETSYCATDPCVSAECCEADAVVADETCADFATGNCTSPMMDAVSTIMCDGACTEADCCVAADAVLCSTHSCLTANWILVESKLEDSCAAGGCVDADCCAAPTCDTFDCPSGQTAIESAATTACTGTNLACLASQCCETEEVGESDDSTEGDGMDVCSDEYAACLADTACAACFNGAADEADCTDTADPTTCAEYAANYCCFVKDLDGCNTDALLVDVMNCLVEADEVTDCTLTDLCDYKDDTSGASRMSVRSTLGTTCTAIAAGAAAAAAAGVA
eukprot:g13354.t1